MTESTDNIGADISMSGRTLEEVTSFKYLAAALCKDGTCSAEFCIRIAWAVAALARLKRMKWNNTISFTSKFKLYKSLVISILLCGSETWTLKKDPGFRNQLPEEISPHF